MPSFDVWEILGIVAVILLIAYWRNKSAVWGGFTLGIIVGFIIAIFSVVRGLGFDWYIIGKGAILGTILGFIAELLGKASAILSRNKK